MTLCTIEDKAYYRGGGQSNLKEKNNEIKDDQ